MLSKPHIKRTTDDHLKEPTTDDRLNIIRMRYGVTS